MTAYDDQFADDPDAPGVNTLPKPEQKASYSFERVMSDLVRAIGEVERLPWPTKDQYVRLQDQAVRLVGAAQSIRYSPEGLAKIQQEKTA